MTPGDIYVFDLPNVGGHEQHGVRPAVVLQDDGYAGRLRTTVVVPLSSQASATRFPGVVAIAATPANGLRTLSYALAFQVRVVDRRRVVGRMGRLEPATLAEVFDALGRLTGRSRPGSGP